MTAFTPISAIKAIELLEAAAVLEPRRVLADYTAADLVNSYAMAIETIEVSGEKRCIRGAAVPAELWHRMIDEGVVDDVWTGGTVRLGASDLIGGAPAVRITGIGFGEKYLRRLVDQYHGHASALRPAEAAAAELQGPAEPAPPLLARKPRQPSMSAIPEGAVLVSMKQAMAALGFSRSKIYGLLNEGVLLRAPDCRSVRIEVASIKKFAGIAD